MAKWLKVETQFDGVRAQLVEAAAVERVRQMDDGTIEVLHNDEWLTVHSTDETLKDYLGVFESLDLGDLA